MIVNYHLVAYAMDGTGYHPDRPRLAARHRLEQRRLQAHVDQAIAEGWIVYAMGDANFHGFTLDGLHSAWTGRPDLPGSYGPLKRIDDIFGPRPARRLRLLDTPSDHRALVATF